MKPLIHRSPIIMSPLNPGKAISIDEFIEIFLLFLAKLFQYKITWILLAHGAADAKANAEVICST